MADQAIYKAQKKTRSTHLLDVLVMKEGDCVTVEGFAAKALKVKKRKKRRRRASRKTATVSDEDFDWTDEVLPADEESSQSPVESIYI